MAWWPLIDAHNVILPGLCLLKGQLRIAAVDLPRVSAFSGLTISKFGISRVTADHIFTWGCSKISSGKVKFADTSDHLPTWAQLDLEHGAASVV